MTVPVIIIWGIFRQEILKSNYDIDLIPFYFQRDEAAARKEVNSKAMVLHHISYEFEQDVN